MLREPSQSAIIVGGEETVVAMRSLNVLRFSLLEECESMT